MFARFSIFKRSKVRDFSESRYLLNGNRDGCIAIHDVNGPESLENKVKLLAVLGNRPNVDNLSCYVHTGDAHRDATTRVNWWPVDNGMFTSRSHFYAFATQPFLLTSKVTGSSPTAVYLYMEIWHSWAVIVLVRVKTSTKTTVRYQSLFLLIANSSKIVKKFKV